MRDRVFRALRKLCPAKLEGRDGDLISVITSDIELLEVFYAHTISPAAIALLFTIVMCLFIGSFHWILGVIALAAYSIVGIVIPIVISRCSGMTDCVSAPDPVSWALCWITWWGFKSSIRDRGAPPKINEKRGEDSPRRRKDETHCRAKYSGYQYGGVNI